MTTKTHQVTGVGPKADDGSCDIFTILPAPFHVTGEWLAAQWKAPEVGDDIVDEDGVLTLAIDDAEEVAIEQAAAQQPTPATTNPPPATDDDTQKKTDGTQPSPDGAAGSATGSAPSPSESPAPSDGQATTTASGDQTPSITVGTGVDVSQTQDQINAEFDLRISHIEKFLAL